MKIGWITLLGAWWVLVASISTLHAQDGVIFDDSQPDYLIMRNAHYELTLRKDNGGIMALVDLATNVSLTLGSRHDCLWGVVLQAAQDEYRGGCSYSPQQVAYQWNTTNNQLTFTYSDAASDTHPVQAVVTITASIEPYFDLRLSVDNHSGVTAINALLPSDLLFADQAIWYGYLPAGLPGVRLEPAFFQEYLRQAGQQYVSTYPSDQAFADYLALDIESSHLAVYTVNPPTNPIQPVALGFVGNQPDQAETFFMYHSFHIWAPPAANWQSPRVRVRVGQATSQTIQAYRQENGLADYPSLQAKLGTRFAQFAHAPLIKHDIVRRFSEDRAEVEQLPVPALLHPVGFQPRGHDENYPDFLPPDPQWGSQADFLAFLQTAQQHGVLVMPYINPTWWDDESPTLTQLTVPLQEVVALNQAGQPMRETYGGKQGYMVSPYAPFVQQRLATLMEQWRREVPVDCVFEDQIGARVWQRDFNAFAPNPQRYSDGWFTHTTTYAERCLMTEMGWDRLAQSVVGFHGSLLTLAREFGLADQNWGAGNWSPYPLALWLFHDKVLLYQHDLSLHTMSEDKAVLTWNLAFGNMLSYNWQWHDNEPLNNRWLPLVTQLQRKVAAQYAGSPLRGFEQLAPAVTRTVFDHIAIIANWHPTLPYRVDQHRIAPGGFFVRSDDGLVVAGLFTGFFNDSYLSAGEHLLLLKQSADTVEVYQLLGETSVLRIDMPASWQADTLPYIYALDHAGQRIGTLSGWTEARTVNFIYHNNLNGRSVEHYLLASTPITSSVVPTAANPVYLPVVVQ